MSAADDYTPEELATIQRMVDHLKKEGYRPAAKGEKSDDYLPVCGKNGQLFKIPVVRLN